MTAGRRTNRRSHFQDLATAIGNEGKATTKRRLSKEERTYKATVPKAMAQMGMGKPSPTSPLYIPTPSLQLPGPTVMSVRQRIDCRATATNQVVTRQQCNGLIQATQGGRRGSLRIQALKLEYLILRTRPASIRPCPQKVGTVGE